MGIVKPQKAETPDLGIDVEATYKSLLVWAENFCPVQEMNNVLAGNDAEKCPPIIMNGWWPKVVLDRYNAKAYIAAKYAEGHPRLPPPPPCRLIRG